MSGLASTALAASMSSSVSFGGRPPVRPRVVARRQGLLGCVAYIYSLARLLPSGGRQPLHHLNGHCPVTEQQGESRFRPSMLKTETRFRARSRHIFELQIPLRTRVARLAESGSCAGSRQSSWPTLPAI